MPFTKTLIAVLAVLLCYSTTALAAEAFDNCCSVPYDKEMLCTDLPSSFNPESTSQLQSLFGRPSSHGACWINGWTELSPIVRLNSCRVGTITRRFKITPKGYDGEPVTCEQTVYINGVHEYQIKFPADVSSNCGVPNPNTIELYQSECDLLSVSVKDERFTAGADECYKVFRTYRMINWCEFNEGNSKAINISRDEDCDGKPGDEPVWVIRKANGDVFIDRDRNERNSEPSKAELKASCEPDNSYQEGYWRTFKLDEYSPLYARRGFWQYTQVIKVFDGNAPRIEPEAYESFCSISNATCRGTADISFSVSESCTPDDVNISVFFYENGEAVEMTPENDIADEVLSGEYPNYSISGEYSIGNHEFAILATDGCGNAGSIKLPFEIADCAAPSPTCLQMISTDLMPVYDEENNLTGGMTVIWAEDFVIKELNDCSSDLTFSIHRQEMIDEGIEEASPEHKSIEILCEDGPIVTVYIYTWDAFGNYGKCVAAVRTTDFLSLCDPFSDFLIAGQIRTPIGEVVDQVEVRMDGHEEHAAAQENGFYIFRDLEAEESFTITPEKSGDAIDGINTMDLVYIKRHILGTIPLENPYQIIAADVNQSGSLTTIDLVHLRRLILSIDTEFRNNDSWRFVDAHHQFTDPQQPFLDEIPEAVTIKEMDRVVIDMDFVAVKTGDVTGNSMTQDPTEKIQARSEYGKTFAFNNQLVSEGQRIQLDFKLNSGEEIAACQFSFGVNAQLFDIGRIQHGALTSEENFNTTLLDRGIFTFSWNTNDGNNFESTSNDLFSVELIAKASGELKDNLQIDSRYTAAMVHSASGQAGTVNLDIQEGETPFDTFQLFQNQPNPLSGQTTIGFYLPKASPTVFTVYSLQGRVLYQTSATYDSGSHRIDWEAGALPAGLYIYQLQAGTQIQSRKMIVR